MQSKSNAMIRPLTSILKKEKNLQENSYMKQMFLKNHERLKEAGEAVQRLRLENKEQALYFEMIKKSQGLLRSNDEPVDKRRVQTTGNGNR